MNNYYTYAYLRKDGTPYYIGKGKGNRIHSKARMVNLPAKEKRIFLKKNLTEEESFKHEKYMIAVFGRKDLGTGILHNRTDGGDGTSGWIMPNEVKEKISKKAKGNNHRFNISHSEETRKKISQTLKNRMISQEWREKISKSMSGRMMTEQHRKNMSKSQKNREITEKHRNNLRKKYLKTFIIVSPSGEIIEEISTIREMCKKYNFNRKKFSSLVNGKIKEMNGWTVPELSTTT